MANADVTFVDFVRGILHPKLSWIMAQLELLGIAYHVKGKSHSGPVLQVDAAQLLKAHQVLLTPVGVLNIAGTLTDENILVMDLRDDHPFFESDTDIDELPMPKLAPIPTSEPEPWDEAPTVEDDPFDVPPVASDRPLPQLASTSVPVKSELLGTDPLEDDPPSVEAVETAVDESDDSLWDEDDEDEETMTDNDPFAEETDPNAVATEDEAEDEHPELDYLRAKDVLRATEVQYNGVTGPVLMYEVDSVNVSMLGCRINQKDQTLCTVYATYKGGVQPYRYGPVKVDNFNTIMCEAVRKAEGRADASVGSAFHHLIKSDADAGTVKCQRLDSTKWVEVLPKSERTKALKKKKVD